MGMTLPSELERLLNDLGFTWPEVDEEDLFSNGGDWMSFGSNVAQAHQSGGSAVQTLVASNQSDALQAFTTALNQQDSPLSTIGDASTGVQVVGGALYVAGGIVIGLKVNTMINLVTLLCEIVSAIAEAPVTFGASLAEIPVFKEITNKIINAIVNEVIMAIMS